MKEFCLRWAVNIIALIIVSHTIAGVNIDSWPSVIAAALVLGLLNAFLRPALMLLTLPLELLSLGLFTLVINGLMFYLASKFVPGFSVAGFWSAFWAAILFSAVSFVLNLLFAADITLEAGRSRYEPGASHKRYKDAIDVEARIADPDAESQKEEGRDREQSH